RIDVPPNDLYRDTFNPGTLRQSRAISPFGTDNVSLRIEDNLDSRDISRIVSSSVKLSLQIDVVSVEHPTGSTDAVKIIIWRNGGHYFLRRLSASVLNGSASGGTSAALISSVVSDCRSGIKTRRHPLRQQTSYIGRRQFQILIRGEPLRKHVT